MSDYNYTMHRKQKNSDPRLSVDVIAEIGPRQIVLVYRRWKPIGWALPGGRVDYGEPLWITAVREMKEETNLDVELVEQFYTYSDPARAAHRHSVTTVFIARATGTPKARDDAAGIKCADIDRLPKLMFDHNLIVEDYLRWKREGVRPAPVRPAERVNL